MFNKKRKLIKSLQSQIESYNKLFSTIESIIDHETAEYLSAPKTEHAQRYWGDRTWFETYMAIAASIKKFYKDKEDKV